MSRMKKKYIIALEDRNVWSCGLPAKTLLLSDVSIFGTDLSSVNTGIELIPYTEPDFEQVRKEAYDKGYDDATEEIGSDEQAIAEKTYQKGLSDAWEAARKIICEMDCEDRRKIFGGVNFDYILALSPTTVIDKLKVYEQNEEMDGLRQNIQTIVDKCGYTLDEIAAVLEKMKEEQKQK